MIKLTSTFRSTKPSLYKLNTNSSTSSTQPSSSISLSDLRKSQAKESSWFVYLIISTNSPIKTYVGVTTDFSRRLKQHNGELKGGAKASRAGRPWVCACLIGVFADQNEACEFESKWKNLSRKLPRKKKNDDVLKQEEESSFALLRHRHAALNRVKDSFDCNHIEIDWHLDPS